MAALTWQFQPWVDSRILDHRRGMAAIIHVHLCTLGLPMDDSQAQTQPLRVRLGPERRPTGGVRRMRRKTQARLSHHFINHRMKIPVHHLETHKVTVSTSQNVRLRPECKHLKRHPRGEVGWHLILGILVLLFAQQPHIHL